MPEKPNDRDSEATESDVDLKESAAAEKPAAGALNTSSPVPIKLETDKTEGQLAMDTEFDALSDNSSESAEPVGNNSEPVHTQPDPLASMTLQERQDLARQALAAQQQEQQQEKQKKQQQERPGKIAFVHYDPQSQMLLLRMDGQVRMFADVDPVMADAFHYVGYPYGNETTDQVFAAHIEGWHCEVLLEVETSDRQTQLNAAWEFLSQLQTHPTGWHAHPTTTDGIRWDWRAIATDLGYETAEAAQEAVQGGFKLLQPHFPTNNDSAEFLNGIVAAINKGPVKRKRGE